MKRAISKQRVNTTAEQHTELLAVAKQVRDAIKPSIGDYSRVFTEPRKNGLRTKFFNARRVDFKRLSGTLDVLKNALGHNYDITVKTDGAIYNYWGDISFFIKFKK